MPCYELLVFAMFLLCHCYVMLCGAMPCYVFAMNCYIIAMSCYAKPLPCNARLSSDGIQDIRVFKGSGKARGIDVPTAPMPGRDGGDVSGPRF